MIILLLGLFVLYLFFNIKKEKFNEIILNNKLYIVFGIIGIIFIYKNKKPLLKINFAEIHPASL